MINDPFSIITLADLPELVVARAAGDQDAAIILKCVAEFPKHVGVDYLAPGLDKGERDTVTVAGKACMNCRDVEFSLDKMPKAFAISIMLGEAFVGGLCEECLRQRTEHEVADLSDYFVDVGRRRMVHIDGLRNDIRETRQ